MIATELVSNEIHFEGEGAKTRETLHPPNFWNRTENTPSITVEQLNDFSLKANFVQRSAGMFWAMTNIKELTPEQRQPWLDIFGQPIAYPTPDTHPLSLKNAVPGIQPPASEG